MTGPDLIRLAEDLAKCGGIHRLTNCIAAACHVFAEHERRARACVEAWEDGPIGVGMSDKAVPPATVGELAMSIADAKLTALREAASRPPSAEEASGGICGRVEAETRPTGSVGALASISTGGATNCAQSVNPHPITPERGERQPLPMRAGNALADEHPRGITHGPGSPIVAEHSGPSDRRVPRFEGKRINPEMYGDGA